MSDRLDDLAGDLDETPETVAPRLLGCHLVSDLGGRQVRVRINEVEAYKGGEDPASHAFRGRTSRNGSMFEPAGTLYVYRSYGIHWCANVAVGPAGTGWAVLFRGGMVIDGVATARRRRGRDTELADGPGKLCQALGIDGTHDGIDLLSVSSSVRLEPGPRPELVMATPRIGITKARQRPWRFIVATTVSQKG